MNSFGRFFRFTSFGESHGPMIGGVVDGCPSGVSIDLESIQADLDRRRPGASNLSSQRKEMDRLRIVSGVYEGRTTGAPIAFLIENQDSRSNDYSALAHVFRPGHADYAYHMRYGIRDHRGGGRASARETATRVVAGAIARQLIKDLGIDCVAYTSQLGPLRYDIDESLSLHDLRQRVSGSSLGCPDAVFDAEMQALLSEVRSSRDSVGAAVSLLIDGVPAGWGDPIFDKLHARFAYAMMSIPAAKGFEYGDGFASSAGYGSDLNDEMRRGEDAQVRFLSNHAGGITGGISLGQRIRMRIAFKPIPSIAQPQLTIDDQIDDQMLMVKGRHDSTVVPRVLVVVEAMAYLVLADAYLSAKAQGVI